MIYYVNLQKAETGEKKELFPPTTSAYVVASDLDEAFKKLKTNMAEWRVTGIREDTVTKIIQ